MSRYLSGLCAAGLGLCGGGWLIVTAVLLGGAPSDATLVTLATGAGVALVSVVGLWCWSLAWRQRMRRDGVMLRADRATSPRRARRSRRALRREMRRTARNRARRGPQQGAQPRSARPDTGLADLGLAGASIAHLVPEPRAPESRPSSPPPPPRSPAAAPRGGEPAEHHPYPPAAAARGGDPAEHLPYPPAVSPPPAPAAACSSASAADVATLVAELRAILEPLLAASGEGEEAW
jgi:hypothetical protein